MLQEQSEPSQPIFAILDCLHDLQAIMRDRVRHLPVSRRDLDAITGLPDGYSSKLLSKKPTKGLGGLSLEAFLQTLGMKIIVIDDPKKNKFGSFPLSWVFKALGLQVIAVDEQHSPLSKNLLGRTVPRVDRQARWGNAAAKTGKQAKEAKEASQPKKSRAAKKRAA
jgi:hypothetical protein